MSGQTPESLSLQLAAILARPVSPQARARAVGAVLDWVGCAVAGAASPAGKTLLSLATAEGQGNCRLISGGRVSALAAALGNGALGNVLEMDDVDKRAVLHPGPVIIPAALALAEAIAATPEAFLNAIVRGYEAVIRIGRAVGSGHYAYWHNTGSIGGFGAAAACASLLNFSSEQTADALGSAGTQASGLWQVRHEPASSAKQLHTARSAQNGLLAAQLAAHGFAGPRFILEGPQGFFAATCPGADPTKIVADPEADWMIHDVSIKPWPACRHAHAAIDAALTLRPSLRLDQVTAIEVVSYAAAVDFCDKPDPKTVVEAKFSFQHAVAVTLLDGPPSLEAFEPAMITDPRVIDVRKLIKVSAGEPYVSAYPARYGAEINVSLNNGGTLWADARDALGDPENPLSFEGLDAKTASLLAWGGMSFSGADALKAATMALGTGGSISDFVAALP